MSDVESMLEDNATDKFFIEHNGYFSNHLAHGVIALHRLGVSSERIQKFIRVYTPKLDPASIDITDDRPIEELKGQRIAYYKILKHFEKLLGDKYKNVDELIRNEYPLLSAGLAASALHGTIHLGYGYSVKNERIILEGLAYTFHSYRPIITGKSEDELAVFGNGSEEVTDVLRKLREKKDLIKSMQEAIKEERWVPLKLGEFQLSTFYMLEDQGSFLTDLVLSLKFGSEVRASDSSLDPIKLGRKVVYLSVMVYALAQSRNNFFILHGVTCSWSMYQILPLLRAEDAIKALREFLTALLAVYAVERSPELDVPLMSEEFTEKHWNELIDRAIAGDRDEHCYKLVQCCYEMAKDARENGEDQSLYAQAAITSLDYKLQTNFTS